MTESWSNRNNLGITVDMVILMHGMQLDYLKLIIGMALQELWLWQENIKSDTWRPVIHQAWSNTRTVQTYQHGINHDVKPSAAKRGERTTYLYYQLKKIPTSKRWTAESQGSSTAYNCTASASRSVQCLQMMECFIPLGGWLLFAFGRWRRLSPSFLLNQRAGQDSSTSETYEPSPGFFSPAWWTRWPRQLLQEVSRRTFQHSPHIKIFFSFSSVH